MVYQSELKAVEKFFQGVTTGLKLGLAAACLPNRWA